MTTQSSSNVGQTIFLTTLGFEDNPFAYTNADEEERLKDYFIPPPYFHSVFGDPDRPKSFVIFAPRGGGKSAQRIMVEDQCSNNQVLAVTYDEFEFANIKSVNEISLHHHLQNILRKVIMHILVEINYDNSLAQVFEKQDRETFVKLATEHFTGVTDAEIRKTLDSLKSIKDKVREFWNAWMPFLNAGIALIAKRMVNAEPPDMGKLEVGELGKPSYLMYELSLVIELAQKIGFRSVYVLVDRVDESAFTGNNAQASFKMVEPMLRDLKMLELKGLGIKFFLWDQLEGFYDDIARKDRVQQESLDWDEVMLKTMWEKRLNAYSNGRVTSLAEISLRSVMPYSIDELALIFANGSPRDMIRIGAQILIEQLQINPFTTVLSPEATYRAINKFCEKRAVELSPRNLNYFRKIGRVDFTIPYLANEIFREDRSSTRGRIAAWKREGNVIEIDRVDNPNPDQNQQVKLLGFADIRIAKVVYPDVDVPIFLKNKYKRCPRCGTPAIREWGDRMSSTICNACQFDLATDAQRDQQEQWRRQQMAAQSRAKQRREIIEAQQMSMFDLPSTPNSEPNQER